MSTQTVLLLALGTFVFLENSRHVSGQVSCISVGSFNVKWFTVNKASDPAVLDTVARVINRYDLMLMLEIRDDDNQTAMNSLWSKVNETASYGLVMSQPLGRYPDFYTEQYAFFYRIGKVDIADYYQYLDVSDNEFEREPFSVLARTPSGNYQSSPGTVFVASHIQPKNAVAEMSHMVTVTDSCMNQWGASKAVVLGDLNADCSYMSQTALSQTPLRTDPRFVWLIPDFADTTVSLNTDCAYDRIIVTNSVLHQNADVFYFDQEYSLTHDQANAVSDHYPVEVSLCGL